MAYLLLTLYSLLFVALAHKNFRIAVGVFIIGLPGYLIRFKIGPLPTTLLELNFGILFLVWLIKYARADLSRISYRVSRNHILFSRANGFRFGSTCFLVFLFSSVIGIFISDQWYISLGQWRAYFLEPMLVFIMLAGRLAPSPSLRGSSEGLPSSVHACDDQDTSLRLLEGRQTPPRLPLERGGSQLTPTDLIFALLLSCLPIDIFGIAQYFTGWHIGNVDWIALQTHRVTSLFLSPNAVALYLVPITLLALTAIGHIPTYKVQNQKKVLYLLIGIIVLNLITIFLCRSLGGWVALFIGTLIYGFINNYKKASVALVAVVLILTALFALDGKLTANKSQSAANRFTLWNYTEEFLTKSPKNFVLGAGIRQFFRKVQKPYYDDKKMERLIYPHNIFLNFWSEIGLFGMLAFVGLLLSISHIAYRVSASENKVLGASLLSAVIAILVHGLIDVPYFKNDLAMLFWIIAAIIMSSSASPSVITRSEQRTM